MFKLPFGSMPGHWGLKGKTRDIAQAEYELTGYELEARLLELNKDLFSDVDFQTKLIELDQKYGKVDALQAGRRLAELITDETQKSLAMLELDYREGKIPELDYTKGLATINKEPWVNVVKMDFSKKSALEGSFELDWNEHFVAKLKSEGYSGPTPDNIVNQWFMELCRNIAMEEFDGTGDFTADSEANLEAVKRWGEESEAFPKGRKGYK